MTLFWLFITSLLALPFLYLIARDGIEVYRNNFEPRMTIIYLLNFLMFLAMMCIVVYDIVNR